MFSCAYASIEFRRITKKILIDLFNDVFHCDSIKQMLIMVAHNVHD